MFRITAVVTSKRKCVINDYDNILKSKLNTGYVEINKNNIFYSKLNTSLNFLLFY